MTPVASISFIVLFLGAVLAAFGVRPEIVVIFMIGFWTLGPLFILVDYLSDALKEPE